MESGQCGLKRMIRAMNFNGDVVPLKLSKADSQLLLIVVLASLLHTKSYIQFYAGGEGLDATATSEIVG